MKKIFCKCVILTLIASLFATDLISNVITRKFDPLKDNEVFGVYSEDGDIYEISGLCSQEIEDPYNYSYLFFIPKTKSVKLQLTEDKRIALFGTHSHAFYVDGNKGTVSNLENGDWQNDGWILSPDGKYILYKKLPVEDTVVEEYYTYVLYEVSTQKVINEFTWKNYGDDYILERLIYKNNLFTAYITDKDGNVKSAFDINPVQKTSCERFNSIESAETFGNKIDLEWQSDTNDIYLGAKVPEIENLFSNVGFYYINANEYNFTMEMPIDEVISQLGEPDKITVYPFDGNAEFDRIEYVYEDEDIFFDFYRKTNCVCIMGFENPQYSISIHDIEIVPQKMTKQEVESLLGRGHFVLRDDENKYRVYAYALPIKPDDSSCWQDEVHLFYDENDILYSIWIIGFLV